MVISRGGGTGRRTGLKIPRWQHRVGSIPTSGILKSSNMADCIFCKIIAQEIPSTFIYQDDQVIVIKDIAPKAKVHYLIIPKKHIADIQSMQQDDQNLAGSILMTAKKLSDQDSTIDSFKLVSNNGFTAGQRVFHIHFHFLSGPQIDVSHL